MPHFGSYHKTSISRTRSDSREIDRSQEVTFDPTRLLAAAIDVVDGARSRQRIAIG